MIQLALIAAFVLIHLHDMAGELGWGAGLPRWAVALAVCGPIAAGGLLAWLVAAIAGRRLDQHGRLIWVRRAERTVAGLRLFALLWYVAGVFALDWPGAVRSLTGDLVLVDELLITSPVLAALVWASFIIYPIERRLREAMLLRHLNEGRPVHRPWTRSQFVWSAVRHQLLFILIPVLVISAWGELVDRGAGWLGWGGAAHLSGDDGLGTPPPALIGVQLGGVLVILAMLPLLLRLVWDTVPLADGPLRDRLVEICRRYRVSVRDLLVWRTHGTMINGAAMGVVGPARYILLSDALLESLTEPQVEAVAAHEVAHVRCRHTLWLALAMLATVTLSAGALGVGAQLVSFMIAPGIGQILATVGSLAAGVAVMGLVSRRFEWQADAFAVKHMAWRLAAGDSVGQPTITPDAVVAMTGALQTVADLNGIPTARASFRHGSIATRQRRLRSLVGSPAGRLRIDRQVGVLRAATVVAVLLAGAMITLGYAMGA